jgi:hypothetical protein
MRLFERMFGRLVGRRVFAVAKLTLKATFRYRLIQVLLLLLATAVVGLPLIIKHDGTAQGFTQILLTYTLGSITVLLGFATLWLGCGTLSREVEECQIQVVVVKPIQRWEIWLGKWLGIVALNGLLLGISGLTVYGLLYWRSSKLPPDIQQQLQQEIFTARGSIREASRQADIEQEAQALYRQRLKDESISLLDRTFVRTSIVETVKSQYQAVPPSTYRRWELDFGQIADQIRDQPLTIRTKFFAATSTRGSTFGGWWEIGIPDTRRHRLEPMSLAPETFHEFTIPADLLAPDGTLTIDFFNLNQTTLIFTLEEGLEVLYPEGGFGVNFIRALGIIFCWLALLTAIGLTAGSFLSFPVAAFCALGVLLVSSSTGTLSQIIYERGISGVNPNSGRIEEPNLVDEASIGLAQGLLWTINLVRDFSPIDSLSTGRSVTWGQLARAIAQIVALMGGFFAAVGITLFSRRELAIAQGT